VPSFEELVEQLVGLERWAADLDRRGYRLLSGLPSAIELDALAEEYAAIANESDALCAGWAEASAPRFEEHALWLRQLSTTTRERCRQHRLGVAAIIRYATVQEHQRPGGSR
jgi:hypothetical protein